GIGPRGAAGALACLARHRHRAYYALDTRRFTRDLPPNRFQDRFDALIIAHEPSQMGSPSSSSAASLVRAPSRRPSAWSATTRPSPARGPPQRDTMSKTIEIHAEQTIDADVAAVWSVLEAPRWRWSSFMLGLEDRVPGRASTLRL